MSKQGEKVQQTPGPRKPADSSVQGFQHPQQVEPRTLNTTRFLKYKSLELRRLNNTFSRFKKAGPYIAGCLALGYAFALLQTSAAKTDLYGSNRNGGDWITLYSRNSDSDMAYNREFQRNRYLSENPLPSRDLLNSEERLAELGIMTPNIVRNHGYDKRAPHPKYYY